MMRSPNISQKFDFVHLMNPLHWLIGLIWFQYLHVLDLLM